MLPAAPRKPPPRKPTGAKKKAGGLGVTKMTTKVDDSLFEQAPAAPPPVLPASAAPVSLAQLQKQTEQQVTAVSSCGVRPASS